MTVYDLAMAVVLARLAGSPSVTGEVRRTHLTNVPRDATPRTHIVDGHDQPQKASNGCRTQHDAEFTVRLFLRSDDPWDDAADLKEYVMDRLNPDAVGMPAYPVGVCPYLRRVLPRTEVADLDVLQVDMTFAFDYVSGYWSLSAVG